MNHWCMLILCADESCFFHDLNRSYVHSFIHSFIVFGSAFEFLSLQITHSLIRIRSFSRASMNKWIIHVCWFCVLINHAFFLYDLNRSYVHSVIHSFFLFRSAFEFFSLQITHSLGRIRSFSRYSFIHAEHPGVA